MPNYDILGLPPGNNWSSPAPFSDSIMDLLPNDAGISKDSPRPDMARPAVVDMRDACELPDDLMGGNRRMRQKCRRWLPQEAKEKHRNYTIRVERSTCFPFYRDTICDLGAMPFDREIHFEQGKAPPDSYSEFMRDVDGTGKSFTVFARDILFWAMHRGMDHVLVDSSDVVSDTKDKETSRRVYATRIDSLSMLDLDDVTDTSGRKRIIYCRFILPKVVEVDRFMSHVVPTIVELWKPLGSEVGTKTVWEFDSKAKKWYESSVSPYNPGENGIPLFTIYTQQVGHYQAEPPLEDLAWVNLAHFQSRSDHAHVMRIARLITLVTLGFQGERKGADPAAKQAAEIELGPLSRINSTKTDPKVFFLEPSGESISLSFKDMESLSDEAKRLGARHLTAQTGHVTARAVTLDNQKAVNNLQAWCLRLEVLLRQVLTAVGEWLKEPLPDEVSPRIYKEFVAVDNVERGIKGLQVVAPALPREGLLKEAKRYGIISDDTDIERMIQLKDDEDEKAAKRAAPAPAKPAEDQFGAGVPMDDEEQDDEES